MTSGLERFGVPPLRGLRPREPRDRFGLFLAAISLLTAALCAAIAIEHGGRFGVANVTMLFGVYALALGGIGLGLYLKSRGRR